MSSQLSLVTEYIVSVDYLTSQIENSFIFLVSSTSNTSNFPTILLLAESKQEATVLWLNSLFNTLNSRLKNLFLVF